MVSVAFLATIALQSLLMYNIFHCEFSARHERRTRTPHVPRLKFYCGFSFRASLEILQLSVKLCYMNTWCGTETTSHKTWWVSIQSFSLSIEGSNPRFSHHRPDPFVVLNWREMMLNQPPHRQASTPKCILLQREKYNAWRWSNKHHNDLISVKGAMKIPDSLKRPDYEQNASTCMYQTIWAATKASYK
jgi:hypothetical protein